MIKKLIDGLISKDIKSISKTISYIENNHPDKNKILDQIFHLSNKSLKIGITGPPGAGKSTITNLLIKYFRKKNKKVGVLLIDPSSPFTGGAVLGDRVRMNMHFNDDNVFIRSLATRGSKGGLSTNADEIADVLDASGFDIIIFETVGVGQVEIDVVEHVDSVVLILVPESGDDIQMLKAGVIEIADIFVINKSDRKDSDKLFSSLENMLNRSSDANYWNQPIIKTVATKDEGVKDLVEKIKNHYNFRLKSKNSIKNMDKKYLNKINNIITQNSRDDFWSDERLKKYKEEINKKHVQRLSPFKFVEKFSK